VGCLAFEEGFWGVGLLSFCLLRFTPASGLGAFGTHHGSLTICSGSWLRTWQHSGVWVPSVSANGCAFGAQSCSSVTYVSSYSLFFGACPCCRSAAQVLVCAWQYYWLHGPARARCFRCIWRQTISARAEHFSLASFGSLFKKAAAFAVRSSW
jgi:hypothetical protein